MFLALFDKNGIFAYLTLKLTFDLEHEHHGTIFRNGNIKIYLPGTLRITKI